MFQVNPLLGRGFTGKIKPYFLRKIKLKLKCHVLQFLFGALKVGSCPNDDNFIIFFVLSCVVLE